jgi:hypothetical protein
MGAVKVETERTQPITVKVVTMGAGVTHYVADTSLTLGRLPEQLALSEEMDVRVNGSVTENTYRLADTDQVLIVPKIRGGRKRR